MMYVVVPGLTVTACFALWVGYSLITYLLERQDRYVAAAMARSNPVGAAIINAPDPAPKNAKDEAKAAGVNPPVPFMG